MLSFEVIASKLLSVVAVPLSASLRAGHSDKVMTYVNIYVCITMFTFLFQLPVSSIVESSGRFLVSRMTELALAASHSEVCIIFYVYVLIVL